ncbi:MAG: hypothetical protein ABI401_05990 [Candidatus Dormibacter sp.]
MQRAIGEHPLTAPPEIFAGELATHHDPSVISRTLGHHVSAEAPAGLLLAVARPSTRQDGPAMIPRPRLQRRAASAQENVTLDAAGELDASEISPPEESIQSAPARELPVIADAPAAQRLSLVKSQAEPEPVGAGLQVQTRHDESRAAEPENLGSPVPPAEPAGLLPSPRSLGQSRRLGLGAPLRQVRPTSIQRAAEAQAPVAFPSEIVPAGNDTIAPADPGEPTVSRLAEIGLDSTQAASTAKLALPLAPSGSGRESAPVAETSQTVEPADHAGAEPTSAQPDGAPVASLQRLAGSADAESVGSADSANALGSAGSDRSSNLAMPGRERDLPLVQRQASRESDPELAEPPSPIAASSAGIDAPAISAHGSSVPAQPESVPASSPAEPASRAPQLPAAAAARGMTATELSFRPSLQRAQLAPLVGSRTIGTRFSMQRTAASPDQGAAATQPTPADRIGIPTAFALLDRGRHETVQALAASPGENPMAPPDGPDGTNPVRQLVRPMTPLPPRPGSVASRSMTTPLPLAPSAMIASVQRSAAEIASLASGGEVVPMQRADLDADQNAPVAGEWPSVQAASAASSGAASTPAAPDAQGRSEEHIDALAGQLYERIRMRLKSELLVDRERAGLLTDLR